MNPRIIAGPPVGLSDGLIVHNQSPVGADVLLDVDGILIAKMQIDLAQAAVDVIFGVEASGNIGSRGTVGVCHALERGRQFENGVAGSSGTICIESRNLQAGGTERSAGGPHCIASR